MAKPADTPVTTPFASTVAIAGFELFQVPPLMPPVFTNAAVEPGHNTGVDPSGFNIKSVVPAFGTSFTVMVKVAW